VPLTLESTHLRRVSRKKASAKAAQGTTEAVRAVHAALGSQLEAPVRDDREKPIDLPVARTFRAAGRAITLLPRRGYVRFHLRRRKRCTRPENGFVLVAGYEGGDVADRARSRSSGREGGTTANLSGGIGVGVNPAAKSGWVGGITKALK